MTDEYGIKIWNTQGSVQIDSNYRNIGYISTIYITDLTAGWAEVEIEDFKWYVIEPLMFDSTRATPFLDSYTTIGGFKKTVKVNRACNIHVFGFIPTPSNMEYGFRVWNANSELVYDSTFLPFKVLDHIKGTLSSAQIDSNTVVNILEKNYGKRVGFCVSRQLQCSGLQSPNFYQRCLFFTALSNGYARVDFKTAYTTTNAADTPATTTSLTDSTLNTYEFTVVDCSFLPQ
jgi:hypothetical protein